MGDDATVADLEWLRENGNPLIIVYFNMQPRKPANYKDWDDTISLLGSMRHFPEEYKQWEWVGPNFGFFVAQKTAIPKRAEIEREVEAVMLSNGFIKQFDSSLNIEYRPEDPDKVPEPIGYNHDIAKQLGVDVLKAYGKK